MHRNGEWIASVEKSSAAWRMRATGQCPDSGVGGFSQTIRCTTNKAALTLSRSVVASASCVRKVNLYAEVNSVGLKGVNAGAGSEVLDLAAYRYRAGVGLRQPQLNGGSKVGCTVDA